MKKINIKSEGDGEGEGEGETGKGKEEHLMVAELSPGEVKQADIA